MREALARVKRDLGADAVILGTRSLPAGGVGGLVGRERVEITAAAPETPARGPRIANGTRRATGVPPLPEDVYPYYVQLVRSEVAEELALRVVQEAAVAAGGDKTAERFREKMRAAIMRMIPTSNGITLTSGTTQRVALIGPPGGGKTTTLAKLAAQFKLRKRKRVAVLSLDMHRMAAGEQLRQYAELIGVPIYVTQIIVDVRELVRRLEPVDLLLIDTPGVGPRDRGRFVRLAALLRAARPQETHLVMPVSLARLVQQRTAEFFGPLGVSRVVLTRLDEAIGLGVVLTAVARMGWALSYLTDGQNVPKNIQEACGRRVAELILPVQNRNRAIR
jgi:flagellar biosynthesis protein FlhF